MHCTRRTGPRATEWTVRSCSVGGSDAARSPEHETVTGTLLLAYGDAQERAARAALVVVVRSGLAADRYSDARLRRKQERTALSTSPGTGALWIALRG